MAHLSARLVPWMVIAALGFGVQTAVVLGLVRLADVHYVFATALAVLAAIVHNYLWHERWTWADRPEHRLARRADRLLRFTLLSVLISVGGGVALTAAFVELVHLPLILANLAAMLTLGMVNLIAADRLAFVARLRRPSIRETQPETVPYGLVSGSGRVDSPEPNH